MKVNIPYILFSFISIYVVVDPFNSCNFYKDPSTVFSTFEIDQSGKIHWYHLKEHLKITELAK